MKMITPPADRLYRQGSLNALLSLPLQYLRHIACRPTHMSLFHAQGKIIPSPDTPGDGGLPRLFGPGTLLRFQHQSSPRVSFEGHSLSARRTVASCNSNCQRTTHICGLKPWNRRRKANAPVYLPPLRHCTTHPAPQRKKFDDPFPAPPCGTRKRIVILH